MNVWWISVECPMNIWWMSDEYLMDIWWITDDYLMNSSDTLCSDFHFSSSGVAREDEQIRFSSFSFIIWWISNESLMNIWFWWTSGVFQMSPFTLSRKCHLSEEKERQRDPKTRQFVTTTLDEYLHSPDEYHHSLDEYHHSLDEYHHSLDEYLLVFITIRSKGSAMKQKEDKQTSQDAPENPKRGRVRLRVVGEKVSPSSSDIHKIFIRYLPDIHQLFIRYSSNIHQIFVIHSADSWTPSKRNIFVISHHHYHHGQSQEIKGRPTFSASSVKSSAKVVLLTLWKFDITIVLMSQIALTQAENLQNRDLTWLTAADVNDFVLTCHNEVLSSF